MDPMTVSQEIGAKRRRATLGFLFTCDHYLVTAMTTFMQMLTVSKAKAGFSGIAREVIHTKKPVIVRDPNDHRLLCVDYLAGYTAKTSLCLGNCKHLHESGHSGDQIMVTCEQKSKSSPPALSPNFLADRHRIHGIRGESKAKQNPAS